MTSKSLAAFLQPKQVQNKEVVISDRFLDEAGKPVPFEIRPILTDEAQSLMKHIYCAIFSISEAAEE